MGNRRAKTQCEAAGQPADAGDRLGVVDPAVVDGGQRVGQRHPRWLELLVRIGVGGRRVRPVARYRCMSSSQKPGAV